MEVATNDGGFIIGPLLASISYRQEGIYVWRWHIE